MLLNKYEISSISEYVSCLEIITCKTVETAKKGGWPEDHLGIKNKIKNIPVDLFPPKNVTLKNHCAKFYTLLLSDF